MRNTIPTDRGRMSVLPECMLRIWWYWRQSLCRQLGLDEALGMELLNGICVWEHDNKVCFRKQAARLLNVPGPGSRAFHTISHTVKHWFFKPGLWCFVLCPCRSHISSLSVIAKDAGHCGTSQLVELADQSPRDLPVSVYPW